MMTVLVDVEVMPFFLVGGDVVDGVSGYLARVEDDAEPESSKRAPLGLFPFEISFCPLSGLI